MLKTARLSYNQVFVILLFSIVFLSFVSSDEPESVDTIHSRGSSWDRYRTTDGNFRTVLYSGTVNYEENGTYLPIDGTIGALEYFERDDTITIIEWADNIKKILPEKTRFIEIENIQNNKRIIKVKGPQ